MSKIHIIDLHFRDLKRTIASFLVETSDGPVLIETGPYSTFSFLKEGIEAVGYKLEDIQHVLLTHIHLDHAGAAWAFAKHGAKIYVHPSGYKHLLDPGRLMNSAKRIYQDQMDSLWGQMKAIDNNLLIQVEDFAKIKIGDSIFEALHTPGHAAHHIAWKLGNVMFTGDVGGVMIKKGIVVPPCPPPDINIEDWMESIQKIRDYKPEELFLTHFGKVTDVEKHLTNLEEILFDWAKWMEPYSKDPEVDQKRVTAEFQEYVKNQLISAGIKASEIIQYETANPSWMSVAGLIRYWNKQNQK